VSLDCSCTLHSRPNGSKAVLPHIFFAPDKRSHEPEPSDPPTWTRRPFRVKLCSESLVVDLACISERSVQVKCASKQRCRGRADHSLRTWLRPIQRPWPRPTTTPTPTPTPMPTVTTAAATWHCLVVRPSAKTAAQARYLGARADEEVGVLDFALDSKLPRNQTQQLDTPFPISTRHRKRWTMLAAGRIANTQCPTSAGADQDQCCWQRTA
jgi:hypothetical protein